MDVGDITYKKEIIKAINQFAGIDVKDGTKAVLRCLGQQNATVAECPVLYHKDKDFLVVVHNPRTSDHENYISV